MNTEDRLAALEARMQELVDRQAIFDCIKRNSRGNDRFDVDLVTMVEDFEHESGAASMDVTVARLVQLRELVRDRITRARGRRFASASFEVGCQ